MIKQSVFWIILLLFSVFLFEISARIGFMLTPLDYQQIRQDYAEKRDIRLSYNIYDVRFQGHPYLPYVEQPYSWEQSDETGMRVFQSENPTEPFVVFAVGGSTTAGPYPEMLYNYLSSNLPDEDIQVVNAGLPAWTTAESLVNLALRGIEYQPDLVVVYHGHNDTFPSCASDFQTDYSHWRTSLEVDLRPVVFDTFPMILDNSAFYVALRHILTPNVDTPTSIFDASTRSRAYFAQCDFSGRTTFANNLISIISVAQAHGADVMLVSQSVHISVPDNIAILRRVEETIEHNMIVEEVANSLDVTYLDFYNIWNPAQRETYHSDIIHLSGDGYQVLAEAIGDRILQDYFE